MDDVVLLLKCLLLSHSNLFYSFLWVEVALFIKYITQKFNLYSKAQTLTVLILITALASLDD